MRYHYGDTLCLSTQVGLPHGLRLLRVHAGRPRDDALTARQKCRARSSAANGRISAPQEPQRRVHNIVLDGQRASRWTTTTTWCKLPAHS